MLLKRSFDFSRYGRDDMFAADGRAVLAQDIEYVCFNDRYVWAYSYVQEQTGLYDSKASAKIDGLSHSEAMAISGLDEGRRGCNGYYIAMVGPGLLYDGREPPFLPSCDWRNLENPKLERQDWFARPCDLGRESPRHE
jgi:hypothetical protein